MTASNGIRQLFRLPPRKPVLVLWKTGQWKSQNTHLGRSSKVKWNPKNRPGDRRTPARRYEFYTRTSPEDIEVYSQFSAILTPPIVDCFVIVGSPLENCCYNRTFRRGVVAISFRVLWRDRLIWQMEMSFVR